MIQLTQAERITALEVKVDDLMTELKSTNTKLDSLLELKAKGMGAFWLASTLAGLLFYSLIDVVIGYFK